MSRVGKNPVAVPAGAEVSLGNGVFAVKGKNGTQTVKLLEYVDVAIKDNMVSVTPQVMNKRAKQNWGTQRALIKNAVTGATVGFTRKLLLQGVGYRANLEGSKIKLSLGLSHDVVQDIPSNLKVVIEGDRNNVILVNGASKHEVGQFASNIRSFRTPEPYGGKGIRYDDEYVVRKEGKKKK